MHRGAKLFFFFFTSCQDSSVRDEKIGLIFGFGNFVLIPQAFKMRRGVGDLCLLNDRLNECMLILNRQKKRRIRLSLLCIITPSEKLIPLVIKKQNKTQ